MIKISTSFSARISSVFAILFILTEFFAFLLSNGHRMEMDEEEGPHAKEFMMREMFQQWNEMMKDPQLGYVPMDRYYNSWAITQQKRNSAPGSRFGGMQWTSRGPSNVGGRTRAFRVSPNDASGNTGFAGSVGGGLWKCTNLKAATPTWSPVNDFINNLA
jgi:hypothetical protein